VAVQHWHGKSRCRTPARACLEHDPEKWAPVFGKDHAPANRAAEKTHLSSLRL